MSRRPDDDGAVEFERAHARLGAAGYEHYEVSSYARPGYRAVHNGLYWRGAEYLGLGNGACSFWRPAADRGVRWANHRAVSRYLAAPAHQKVESSEELDAAALAGDALWLGLRTGDGVPREAARGRERVVDRLLGAGLLVEEGGRLRPTPRGFLLSDLMGVELLE
jgi:oxygen-independent coproporphyrinogen-3 oxidase